MAVFDRTVFWTLDLGTEFCVPVNPHTLSLCKEGAWVGTLFRFVIELLLSCTGILESVEVILPSNGVRDVVGKKWLAVVGWFIFLLLKLSLRFDAAGLIFESENHTGLWPSSFTVGLVGKISGRALGISVTGTEFGSSFWSFFSVFFTKVGLSCCFELFVPLFFFEARIFACLSAIAPLLSSSL